MVCVSVKILCPQTTLRFEPHLAGPPGTQLPQVALWQPREPLAAPVFAWLVCDLVQV